MKRLGVRNTGTSLIKKKKFTRFDKIKLLTIILLPISIFILIQKTNIFSVSSIEIKKENVDCTNDSQILETSQLLGRSVFIDHSRLEKKIKDNYICIGSVKIEYIFPRKIVLLVQGRKAILEISKLQIDKSSQETLLALTNYDSSQSANIPAAQATSSASVDNTPYYLLDEEGVVFGNNTNGQNLAKLLLDSSDLKVGKKYEGQMINALMKAKSKLDNLGTYPRRLILLLERFLVVDDNPKIIFDLDQNIDQQLASLQLILQMAKIDNENVEFIDLRFDKPVVRYAPKKK